MPLHLDADTLVTLITFLGIFGPVTAALLLTLYIARTAVLEKWGRQ